MMAAARPAVLLACVLVLASCGKREESPWKALPLGTSADFRDVFFADPQRGWIAGGAYNIAGGLIGRTDDGGKTWQFSSGMISPHPHANGHKVEALHFFEASRGVAVSDGGKIFLTSDGGENWGEVRRWTGPTDYLFDVEFIDENHGWAVGLAGVLRTTDGGRTWMQMPKKDEEGRIEGRAISVIHRDRLWIVGQTASVMTTDDAARTWTRVEMPLPAGERLDFWDVFFVDESVGWICGEEGTLFHTSDGGRTWSLRPLGIEGVRSAPKLERIPRAGGVAVIDAGDRTPGLTLASIHFVDSKTGWIAGFFANMGRSLILHTRDGGTTWTVDADIEGEELRSLFALDGDHVWAVGARTRPGDQAIFYRAASAAN
jgi:photosystem II stability/assembly factor-like uncharacterized protein